MEANASGQLPSEKKPDAVLPSVAALALAMEKGFAEEEAGRAFDRVLWLLMSTMLVALMARDFNWI